MLSRFFLVSLIAFLLASVGCFDFGGTELTIMSTLIELVIITSKLFNALACKAQSLNSLASLAKSKLDVPLQIAIEVLLNQLVRNQSWTTGKISLN
jgi:hypothetical protein